MAAAPPCTSIANQFDIRGDVNPSQTDQVFARFSYSDDPIYIPGIFGGIADGGSFYQGIQTAKSAQAWLVIPTSSRRNTTNQVRAGFAHLHTTRYGPEGAVNGIPAQFGIQGIPQGAGERRAAGLWNCEPGDPGQQQLPAFG